MSRLTVQLQVDEQMALAELARRERRDARNQAAVIIRRELKRQGLLPEAQQEAGSEQPGVTHDRR